MYFLRTILHLVCPGNYTLMKGDVPGQGLTGGYESSLHKCADNCTARTDCNGFEYSKTSHECKLVQQNAPTAFMYQDYQFCSKVGGKYLEYLKTI